MTAELAAAMSKVEVEMDSMRREVATSRSETATAKQRADRALAGIGNFRLSGDVRVRYEQQVQGAGFVTRHRERTRARLNLTGDVSERLSGGISIASGDLVDHQSSNQTQTNVFSRKTVGLDRFFIQYKPAGATGFAVIGGKFPYAWERTSLTMSNDINPEGIAPSFTWVRKGRLERVAVIGYMLPFWEVSSGDDSYAVGGQLQTRWRLTPKWSARASVGTMAFEGADAIAVGAAKGSVKPSAPSANALRRDSTNTVLGFANNYHLDDVVLRADYSGFAGWPVTLEAHAVRNRFAPSGEGFAYRAGVSAGQLREIKDLQFTWALFHIGREAVIGTLNEQDLRASTNAATHRFGASLRILPNAVFNAALWRGRLLDPRATTSLLPAGTRTTCVGGGACREPWLNRIQVDVAYTF
ncbi:MAG: putative porin [Gemmatimonadaceae bacterium]|nr:putative porin [Gemmatimonadaceae bacterium]